MSLEMDDKDFYQVRKNLNIISIVILVLAFTNAEVNSLNVIGIDLELNGNKLYAAIFILYAYFIWRFLTKLPLKSEFWNGFLKFYMEAENGVLKQHNFKKYYNKIVARSEKLREELKNPETRVLKQYLVRFAPNPITKLRLIVTFYLSKQQPNGSNNIDGTHDFEVSKYFLINKFFRFCIKSDKFGDYLFPLGPVLINLIFFIFLSEWQGSFYNLLLK